MKIYFILFVISIILINSCQKTSTEVENELNFINWKEISINQVYYDSLKISSQNTILINSRSVESVILFELENNEFVPKDTIIPTYTETGDNYYLNFHFHKKVSKEILNYNFKVQYKIDDDKFFEIDTTHLMLRFPYKSAQLFITTEEVWQEYGIVFQDIDLNKDFLFFHPGGPFGLYKYNFNTKQSTELMRYPGGDFIAYDSIYVFVDDQHTYVKRYNLELDTVDLEFNLSSLTFDDINGIECYGGYVYVIFNNIYSNNFIAKFDLNGSYLSSITYPRNRYCLTIESDIAYSQNYGSTLFRFDLLTNTDLSEKLTPVYNGGGFRVYSDRFYFVDWDKRAIGYIPLSELM